MGKVVNEMQYDARSWNGKEACMAMIRSIPALPVRHISEAVTFYRDCLGFEAGYSDDGFAIMTRDAVELHLWASADESWRGRGEALVLRPVISGAESFLAGTASCRIEVERIDQLFEEYGAAASSTAPTRS